MREPRSAFNRLVIIGFLGAGMMSGILAIVVGFPSNVALLIVATAQLICAGLALTRLRWMPLLLTGVGGMFLYQIAKEPFVIYHLTNPKTGGFFEFALDIIIIAFVAVAFGASLGAAAQNYFSRERKAPGWLPSSLTGVAGIVIGAILIGAIAQPSAAAETSYTNGVPTVHMSAGNFNQPSVTIAKGARLLLVDDVAVPHILANGSWLNGRPQPMTEPDAPVVADLQVNGNSDEIGPFSAAGAYHIYCPLHQGMNLTIVVQ
jgi:plastocyanin